MRLTHNNAFKWDGPRAAHSAYPRSRAGVRSRKTNAMEYTIELSEFNRRMADALGRTFASSVRPYQTKDGALVFRGPIVGHKDPHHVGTHVHISLEDDVLSALDNAEPSLREEMIEVLLANLGTQVRMQYDPKNIGPYALSVTGTMSALTS